MDSFIIHKHFLFVATVKLSKFQQQLFWVTTRFNWRLNRIYTHTGLSANVAPNIQGLFLHDNPEMEPIATT